MKTLLTTDSDLPIQIFGYLKRYAGIKKISISLNQTLKWQKSADSTKQCKQL